MLIYSPLSTPDADRGLTEQSHQDPFAMIYFVFCPGVIALMAAVRAAQENFFFGKKLGNLCENPPNHDLHEYI